MGAFNMESFLNFAIATTVLMIGNAASGAMKARKKGEFDKQKLIDGCINYALWLVCILCLVAATEIYGGDKSLNIDGTVYTLAQAVDIAKSTVYVVWAGKLIQNVYEYSGISRQIKLDKLINENTGARMDPIGGLG